MNWKWYDFSKCYHSSYSVFFTLQLFVYLFAYLKTSPLKKNFWRDPVVWSSPSWKNRFHDCLLYYPSQGQTTEPPMVQFNISKIFLEPKKRHGSQTLFLVTLANIKLAKPIGQLSMWINQIRSLKKHKKSWHWVLS